MFRSKPPKAATPSEATQPDQDQEISELIRLARKYAWASLEIHERIQRGKVCIEPARFYSQLPTLEEIRGSFEYAPGGASLPVFQDSTVFSRDRMRQFMRDVDAYAEEFDPPQEGDREDPAGYFWQNPAFSYSDAMSYWCAIRHYKPRRLLEIGSGFSSLLAASALETNGVGELTCIEPYPKPWLAAKLPQMTLIDQPVQSIEAEDFNQMLGDGDMLFIDSTHSIKIGSDCLWIYLKLLPALTSNVIVHVHDISLPYGIDQRRAMTQHIHWAESYLLMAYLIDNPRCEVLFGSHMVARQLPEEAEHFMRGRMKPGGGSLWFRQRSRV